MSLARVWYEVNFLIVMYHDTYSWGNRQTHKS